LPGLTTTTARVRGVIADLERREVEVPLAVVHERVAPRLDRLELGEELEQRIARARHQHLVAGVAEQLEQERVRLAGARVQQDALGVDRRAAARRSRGRRRPGRLEAEGGGIVAPGLVAGERREQLGRVGERGARRVRQREVEEGPPSARCAASRSASRLGRRSKRVRAENIAGIVMP
jgi:hypothetical protein